MFLYSKPNTSYEMRMSDMISDVCSSELQEAAADPEKAREDAGAKAVAQHLGRVLTVALCAGRAARLAPAQHQHADHDHQQGEQEQQLLPFERLARRRSEQRADNARLGIHPTATPFDGVLACVSDTSRLCIYF